MATPRPTKAHRDRLRRQVARGHPPCHLCHEPIDYSLKSPDPYSFEIDHVIPRSKGGADTVDNLAPAHRRCNREKWDTDAQGQAVVFETTRIW